MRQAETAGGVIDEGRAPTLQSTLTLQGPTRVEPPTEEGIEVLRTQVDVRGQAADAAGGWIIWGGEKHVRQAG